ncbi:MAG: CpsD/CapB family tyrosine-protein kinase [Paludisphaera borealis]|uniref:CpsD/CapB family tyrosine-protein kinase n=1 Tax=Paludisphaera borealis TaxID=1387353 RepID=UPI00284E2541|nr:CpsD/CapB family tyrosine-protein kinase [Paludisphaera borealis]MDR3619632.1 CpsD/CapB family tyrosine-protein kinase [Paludisphaera borealis]
MKEVDEALSRAYSQRTQANSSTGVPPSPHWTSRKPGDSDRAPAARQDSSERGGRGRATEPLGLPAPGLGHGSGIEIQWPDVVEELERAWGDRFESLADRLLEVRARRNLKVILFTSCHRAEGRTTLVLTLARVLARRPLKTLLVDADLSGPMLARSLGVRPLVGLDDVVEDGQALNEALIESPDERLWLLPMRSAVSRPREFLSSAAWSCAMARLRREFDLVLIDGSPLFTGLSAAVLHNSVDAAVLVHNSATTGQRAILRAQEVLEAGGVPLLGLAETFV